MIFLRHRHTSAATLAFFDNLELSMKGLEIFFPLHQDYSQVRQQTLYCSS